MKNVPNLRFQEFSEEWETTRAENIFRSITDKKHDGNLLVLSATQDRGVIPRNETGIDIKYEKENLSSYKRVKYNDYIISLRSFQGGIEHSKYEGLVSPAYTVFNFKDESLFNHDFFAAIFKSQNFINRLNTLTYGIRDGKAISFTDFSSMKLIYPKKKEQEKIAAFFSLIDKKIELQTEKVEELKNYKKGIMQKIFSQELRFKDENGNEYSQWENKRLGEIGEIVTGKTPSTHDSSLWDGEIQFVTPTDINGSKYQLRTLRTVTQNSKMKVLPKNSIMYTCIASIGKISLSIAPCITNQQINSLIPQNQNNEFIYYSLLNITPKIKSTQANTTLPIINKEDFSKFIIPLPSLPEQEKIVNVLSRLDNIIEKEQEKLKGLGQYKKGLLQQMFV